MKSLLILLAIAALPLLAGAQSLFDSPAPTAGNTPGAPAASPAAATTDAASAAVPMPGQSNGISIEKNLPLIPGPDAPGGGKSHSHKSHPSSSPAGSATMQTEQDIQARVRIRKAETHVLNDPAIQAAWAAAHAQPTDPARRAALAAYYTRFYARVLKLEPTLATQINARKQGALLRMQYPRLDPDFSESPTPSPDYSTSDMPQ